jgi:hypothetical protein
MTTNFVSLSHNVALISYFMAHYRVDIKTNTTGATWKAGKHKLPEFPLVCCRVCIAQSLVFSVGVRIIIPFRFDTVLFSLCQFTCFADHFRVFKRLCSGACADCSLVFSVGLCRPLFALLFFDLWPLYCLPSISGFYVFASINLICFRPYYLLNQYIHNKPPGKLCNRKCYIPTAKDDISNCER